MIYYLEDQTRENMGEWIKGLNASGYAGCCSNGFIVDRRQFPDAIPVQANSLFGVVQPKEVTEAQREEVIRLGKSFPVNEQEMEWWDDEFKDYPYQLTEEKIDPYKILEMAKIKTQ